MKIRYNTSKFDRDPEKYLGIDGHRIPLKMFIGVEYDPGALISPTKTGEILFHISEDARDVTLFSNNSNAYVSIEDMEDTEEWFIINRPLREYKK